MIMKDSVTQALKVLRSGGLILYPTDTVWGIGCDATNEEAVRKVFALKRRSDSKSLVLLARDMEMIAEFVDEVPFMAEQLVEVNDAPMTIIYPGARIAEGRIPGLAPSCVAQDGSVGIRIPSASRFCNELLAAFGAPIVSTSANISGEATPSEFDRISPEVISGVDYVVPVECQGVATSRPSQIIKLGLGGEVTIIRG